MNCSCNYYDEKETVIILQESRLFVVSRLASLVNKINEHSNGVILFQPLSADKKPNFSTAKGILRKTITDTGSHWSFCTLMPINKQIFTGCIVTGDQEQVAKIAEYQFGSRDDKDEWVIADYSDPNFPQNLCIV